MGDTNNSTFWHEIGQAILKFLTWFGYIAIGVMAKLAFDSRSNVLTRRQIIIKSVLSIFCGYAAAVVCEQLNYVQWGKLIVPVSTLLGEGIIVYIMSNWKKWCNKLLPPWLQDITNNKK